MLEKKSFLIVSAFKMANDIDKFLKLNEQVLHLLKSLKKEKTDLDIFLRSFERCYGLKLNFRDYGFDNDEDFIKELIKREIIKIDLTNKDFSKLSIICPFEVSVLF